MSKGVDVPLMLFPICLGHSKKISHVIITYEVASDLYASTGR